MAQWNEGYVTDVTYTSNFYRELTPVWLGMTSLLLGHRSPDPNGAFSYADLGCGNGFTTLVIAACYPQADIWGFDFNPAHIEFATNLATQAALTNVHFVETSFADLAALPDTALPDFDFIVSHGVLSWISPANRKHLIDVVARRLKPGGLAYLSYNGTAGWASLLPVRSLMRMLTAAGPERTDLAVPGVLDFIDRLRQSGASYFAANPAVEARIAEIRKQDPRYIAHEFLNHDWHPLMFADVAAEMQDAKCQYIGSATLTENIDSVSVPAGVVPLLAEMRDPVLRETIRDIGCAQAFRRDLYRRGISPLPAPEQQELLETLTITGTGQVMPEQGPSFATSIGNVTGRTEIYQPLDAMLRAGPLSIERARAMPEFANRPLIELMQAFTLLVAGNYAHPVLPGGGSAAAREAATRLNLAIARANGNGAEMPRFAAPALGSAVGADIIESLLVGELLAGRPAKINGLVNPILAALARSGRNVQRDGKVVTDAAEAGRIVKEAVQTMLEKRVPLLKGLGILPA